MFENCDRKCDSQDAAAHNRVKNEVGMGYVMKVATVVGARPQFIKAAAVSRELKELCQEVLVDTGQHYDYEMSELIFEETGLRSPDYALEVGSGLHGAQTGKMLERIERVLLAENPDWVLVYGDTNSTVAGALAASKLGIPVGHVEAGLRSYNRAMPEEINRIVADHLSELLFVPTETAMKNLEEEGLSKRAIRSGDVMMDALAMFGKRSQSLPLVFGEVVWRPKTYALLTLHRPYNVDDPDRLKRILCAVTSMDMNVLFPVHPRTYQRIREFGLASLLQSENLECVKPLGYLEMLRAEACARVIMTDSGGVQKEAYMLKVPCITFRPETEWLETLENGWNVLVGIEDLPRLMELATRDAPDTYDPVFGVPGAARIVARSVCGI